MSTKGTKRKIRVNLDFFVLFTIGLTILVIGSYYRDDIVKMVAFLILSGFNFVGAIIMSLRMGYLVRVWKVKK